MRTEPTDKRTIAFVDGQNLFHLVRLAFHYSHPNFDVRKLAGAVCQTRHDWSLSEVRFYTGIPPYEKNVFWRGFWDSKLAQMQSDGVVTFGRNLVYHTENIELKDCEKVELRGCKGIHVVHKEGKQLLQFEAGREKGIDIRIALDLVRLARLRKYDVALLFSQDQDFVEVAEELRAISLDQDRWIKIASAYPFNVDKPWLNRGIDKTDWIAIDRTAYDRCIDSRDYRAGR